MENIKVRFKEGDQVAYKDNLYLPMTVKEIIYKKVEVPTEAKDDGSGFVKKMTSKLDGILCQWFDKDGKYMEVKFHSKVLVPWEIAEEGAMEVIKYLNRE